MGASSEAARLHQEREDYAKEAAIDLHFAIEKAIDDLRMASNLEKVRAVVRDLRAAQRRGQGLR